MSKICIIGNGYIATHLKKKVKDYSWYPTKDTEVIFYMSGPTHLDFEKNPDYFLNKETAELVNLNSTSKAKILYPSSALVYEINNQFTHYKKEIEQYILSTGGVVTRIFPVYGHEEKTFIGQAIKDMKADKSPVIYGYGNQTRDFVFIDDVVDQILYFAQKDTGIYDIGTGEMTSFNTIIDLINKSLGKDIKPTYVYIPIDYVIQGVQCKQPLLNNTPVEEAIKKLCED